MWDFVYGCDVGFEVWEESFCEVGFQGMVLELVDLLMMEFFGVDGCVGVDGVVFSESDE